MRNLKLLFFGMLMLVGTAAMAQFNVTFGNNSPNYYTGGLYTQNITGCPTSTTPPCDHYYDIPDGRFNTAGAYDENGNLVPMYKDVTGLSITNYNNGNTFSFNFCSPAGLISLFGMGTFIDNGPRTYTWFVVGNDIQIIIS